MKEYKKTERRMFRVYDYNEKLNFFIFLFFYKMTDEKLKKL